MVILLEYCCEGGLPCQPRLLIGSHSDGLELRSTLNAFGDVGRDDLTIFLEVSGVIVGGSLLKHISVSGDKKESLSALVDPSGHTSLFADRFGDLYKCPVCWL